MEIITTILSINTIGSSPAIYEDLNCLHLTDETVVCKEDKITVSIKSPIVESLFSNVSSVIYFSTKDEIVSAMPENILPLMKWKLSTITPVPIKEIVLKCGFHLVDADTTENWIGTWGKHLKCTSFRKIKNFQKVNHYPGSFHLGRKDRLWNNYKRMQNRFGEDDFNFFPETFLLPADMKSLKKTWENETDRCWIIKPPASARGTGVKVIHKWGQVPKNRPVVVQKYVSDPYLINGTKFDLRIYVLISSIEPLRVYVFEDGLVRFASEKYSLSNKSFSNRYIHLTNYSINRKSSSYTANEDENSCQGHKWSLKSFWSYMSSSGIAISKIQEAIMDMIIKTIISTEGPVCRLMKTYARSTYNCYELFGFDIMLDKDLRPWLLEVNISPSLHTRSLLDSSIKGQLVKDMLNIVGFQVPLISSPTASDDGMLSYSEIKQSSVRNRYLSPKEKKKHAVFTFQYADMKSDILEDLTPDDVRCLVESEDEFHRKGAFTRVFPSETSSKYFVYFEHIRYYNLLLDAWEKCYYKDRSRGISHLQELCNEKYHLQINMHYKDSNQMPTAESV
ncbi:tubulin polyglutamylase TTLL4-like [Stegodyphus dumicola]|uniref:tubulin polyglutamylase TTLL4-like n=1 Tax=Stegodyphus dumicola TaxID=202533 RepID=UPI0015AF3775|nr:tubulin polyglutamylase TTLL4-like [Stegodyphus dumicola]